MTKETLILVALGGNLPFGASPADQTLQAALTALVEKGFEVKGVSALYRTPAFPAGSGSDYVNAAAAITLRHWMEPSAVLAVFHQIEAQFGRERLTRWQGRTLDIDLIAVGDRILPDPATQDRWRDLAPAEQARVAPDTLILPHPRLQDRAFVLVPMADVAPEWRHPILGLTVRQMRDALPKADLAAVVALQEMHLTGFSPS